jgi:group II intron reverse transcriptase/maturase
MDLFETEFLRGKSQPITTEMVEKAFRKVKSKGGAEGVDGKDMSYMTEHKRGELYKLWNRMASGSYYPKAVRAVEIPKSDGSMRLLGIPTISDRIAQQVAKSVIEPIMEQVFHIDSYGYRPNRSAHDALRRCQQRCHEYRWVIDMDIKGFFDNIDHKLMMRVLRHYIKEDWILMYVERWLEVPTISKDGVKTERTKGTPQGGVISPILANMFLHVVFDAWMEKHYANTQYGTIRWERYADDIIVHCKNEKEARYILNRIRERFTECKLELHPEKTKIVYCKQSNRRGGYKDNKFDFLGFTFKPGSIYCKDESGKGYLWLGYVTSISRKASKRIVQQIEKWKIHRATGAELADIAIQKAPVIRGWINYYGHFRLYCMKRVFRALNARLVRWVTNKYKRYRRRKAQARQFLCDICSSYPALFEHWKYGFTPDKF